MKFKLTFSERNNLKAIALIKLSISGIFILLNSITLAQSWSSLAGGGMNDWVYATIVYNGELIAAGKFTSAGGIPANHIAKWNGTNWAPLGLGVNGKVNALAIYNGNLVAAGEFTMAGNLEVNFIAQWDGTTWDDQLGGVGSIVTSLAVIGNDLYVGGYFTDADGVPANFIAKRNNNGWFPLGSGMGGTQGQVMALTVSNGQLYAGGFFTTAGGLPANHIAKWNGSAWSPLGSGINNIVYALTEYNGNLVAGGLFSGAGGTPANNIASWNGSAWSAFGSGMSGILYQYVLALKVYNGNLIAGGYFTASGGITTNGIAKWDGASWNAMGGGLSYPANVFGAHTLCQYGTDLIVGGLFSSAGSVSASHIAVWSDPYIPVNLTINNDTVFSFWSQCYNATQDITVAGNGTSFVVQNGGNATLIAGQTIHFLPGTLVQSGGYLLGTISTNGQYCGMAPSPASNNAFTAQKSVQIYDYQAASAKVYPNPTRGDIYIEWTDEKVSDILNVLLINQTGEKFSPYYIAEKNRIRLSLNRFPAGVYFLRLTSDNGSFFSKIIKTD